MPRELYALIGPSTPALSAQLAKPRLKQKPNFGGTAPRTKWELRTFKNPARKDGLELRHWEKVGADSAADYPFAKYDIQPNSYQYSPEEYTRLLEDKDWTKEETDYLLSVVKEYDSRWYIVHDRYNFPGGHERTLEDLKDRYCSVCRKLIRNRPWAGDDAGKTLLISSYQFDKEREVTRKKYLKSLEDRTPDQMAEEEALYIEVKRLEQSERRFKRDRENLLRTLAGIDSGLPDIVEDDPLPLAILEGSKTKTKKTKGVAEAESPATPAAAPAPTVKKPIKSAAYDAQHCIIRTETLSAAIATKAAHQPAYLRSFKLPAPKAAIAPKVTQALAELGISHTRLVMPTRENALLLDSLIEATTTLVETKRAYDKAEYEIQVLENRLGLREKSQPAEGAEGKIEGGAGMDVNDAQVGKEVEETDGEDGRAQSILSARSGGRSRKHARRSMSISSVDTVSTRANNKRQKRN
ncbi:unnamed protein product [Cyclocybe aegerita]|uniref:SWR1-complex protein 4 n=1 Tax=Cyclocybe aegerita TaxID=1973307 RepID=A0A8S0XM11_CYCAE|nr:unnamed protein product [Cyclocybe aegerita]